MLFIFLGCSFSSRLYYAAPTELSSTSRAMKTPGFWVSQYQAPDEILMTDQEIKRFNEIISDEKHLVTDLSRFHQEKNAQELKEEIIQSFLKLSKKTLWQQDGQRVDDISWNQWQNELNLDSLEEVVPIRYGLIVHYANQRLLPTDDPLYALKGDVDFDELQNSALDVGTPVVIWHESQNQEWFYLQDSLTSGWVRKDQIAFGKKEDVLGVLNAVKKDDVVVVTHSKADIFLNSDLTNYYDYVRMGARFILNSETLESDPQSVGVKIPVREDTGQLRWQNGFFKSSDVAVGFLPYSQRTILEQAFKLLNAPYGWGGMFGEQDCSRFLQMIFATTGIFLPRNSSAQAQVGKKLFEFDDGTVLTVKSQVLQTALGGMTILPMKGHIMLYLGKVNDRFYAIHATWAYRESYQGKDRVRLLNRVVVSDLDLGAGSKKGSLLKRLSGINEIRF